MAEQVVKANAGADDVWYQLLVGMSYEQGQYGRAAQWQKVLLKRNPGSMGPGTNPSRVIKGKRMPGHMGDVQQTVRNIQVAKIDAERNLLYLRGAVPGPVNSVVFIIKQ